MAGPGLRSISLASKPTPPCPLLSHPPLSRNKVRGGKRNQMQSHVQSYWGKKLTSRAYFHVKDFFSLGLHLGFIFISASVWWCTYTLFEVDVINSSHKTGSVRPLEISLNRKKHTQIYFISLGNWPLLKNISPSNSVQWAEYPQTGEQWTGWGGPAWTKLERQSGKQHCSWALASNQRAVSLGDLSWRTICHTVVFLACLLPLRVKQQDIPIFILKNWKAL